MKNTNKTEKAATNNAANETKFTHPNGARRKVRAWLLKDYPSERSMIGRFRKDVTFAEIYERMHKGEDFYAITKCDESQQREYCFLELAEIYGVDYDYFYDLWLTGADEVLGELKRKGDVNKLVRYLANKFGKRQSKKRAA